MSFLIEKNGERQHVKSLKGYEGWTVLKKGRGSQPVDHAEFVDGKWKVDPDLKARREKRTALVAMVPRDWREHVVDRLDALEAEIARLSAAIVKKS
jgi:hypothetical protein